MEKNAVNITKSARKNGWYNKQFQGSPRGLLDTNTYQVCQRAGNRSSDQITSTDKWKCGVRGLEPHRRPSQAPHTNNDHRELHVTDRLYVCITTQLRKLPPPMMGAAQYQALGTERF